MGNENCSQVYQVTQQNQAYGDYKIIKENNRQIAEIQKNMEYCPELKRQVQEKLKQRLKLKSTHLVKLNKYAIHQTKYTFSVHMFYDFIGKNLSDRKFQMQEKGQPFSERELFNIIYGVQNALEQLNSHNIRHGCINAQTILCQGNFYKISDVSSTTFVKSYDLVRRGCRKQFLSEKLLTNLEYKSLEPFYQIEDDFFSLGMLILTLVVACEPKHFYQWKQKTLTAGLNWKNIANAIEKVERNYSSKLSNKIKDLIKYQPEREQEKSLATHFTTSLNSQVNELDKQIDRVLGKVFLNNSHSGSSSRQQQQQTSFSNHASQNSQTLNDKNGTKG